METRLYKPLWCCYFGVISFLDSNKVLFLNIGYFRKTGGKFGFAESLPQERITALKTDVSPVEMSDVKEKANEIVQRAEVPPQTYPFKESLEVTLNKFVVEDSIFSKGEGHCLWASELVSE